jgi:hypothetical protein
MRKRRKTLTLSNGRSLKQVRAALYEACIALTSAKSYTRGIDKPDTVWVVYEQARASCARALLLVNDGKLPPATTRK